MTNLENMLEEERVKFDHMKVPCLKRRIAKTIACLEEKIEAGMHLDCQVPMEVDVVESGGDGCEEEEFISLIGSMERLDFGSGSADDTEVLGASTSTPEAEAASVVAGIGAAGLAVSMFDVVDEDLPDDYKEYLRDCGKLLKALDCGEWRQADGSDGSDETDETDELQRVERIETGETLLQSPETGEIEDTEDTDKTDEASLSSIPVESSFTFRFPNASSDIKTCNRTVQSPFSSAPKSSGRKSGNTSLIKDAFEEVEVEGEGICDSDGDVAMDSDCGKVMEETALKSKIEMREAYKHPTSSSHTLARPRQLPPALRSMELRNLSAALAVSTSPQLLLRKTTPNEMMAQAPSTTGPAASPIFQITGTILAWTDPLATSDLRSFPPGITLTHIRPVQFGKPGFSEFLEEPTIPPHGSIKISVNDPFSKNSREESFSGSHRQGMSNPAPRTRITNNTARSSGGQNRSSAKTSAQKKPLLQHPESLLPGAFDQTKVSFTFGEEANSTTANFGFGN